MKPLRIMGQPQFNVQCIPHLACGFIIDSIDHDIRVLLFTGQMSSEYGFFLRQQIQTEGEAAII